MRFFEKFMLGLILFMVVAALVVGQYTKASFVEEDVGELIKSDQLAVSLSKGDS